MSRWDIWTSTQGRPPDPLAASAGLGRSAWAHLGVTLLFVNVGALIAEGVAGHGHAATAAALLLVGGIVALGLLRPIMTAESATVRELFGIVAVGGCVYLAFATGLFVGMTSASSSTQSFVGSLVLLLTSLTAYAWLPSTGPLIATAAAFTAAPLFLLQTDSSEPRQLYAAALIAIAVVHASAVHFRLVRETQVLLPFSIVTATAGVAVQAFGHTPGAVQFFCVVLLLCLAWLCAEQGGPLAQGLLVIGAAGDLSLLARTMSVLSWPAVGPAIAGAVIALVAADRFRRDPVAARVDGVLFLGTLAGALGAGSLLSEPTGGANVLGALVVVDLLIAGILTGRRLVVVAAIVAAGYGPVQRVGLAIVSAAYAEEVLLAAAGLVALIAALRIQPRRPQPLPLRVLPGLEPGTPQALAVSERSYGEVFDALVSSAVAVGPVQLADRARGRLAAEGLAVAVWQASGFTYVAGTVSTDAARRIVAEVGEPLPQ